MKFSTLQEGRNIKELMDRYKQDCQKKYWENRAKQIELTELQKRDVDRQIEKIFEYINTQILLGYSYKEIRLTCEFALTSGDYQMCQSDAIKAYFGPGWLLMCKKYTDKGWSIRYKMFNSTILFTIKEKRYSWLTRKIFTDGYTYLPR
jgi:UDP-galactopyranose mutase